QALGPQTQYLPDATHRHSLGWHRLPFLGRPREPMRFNQRSSAATQQGGADFKSESVADLDRNEWPTSNRNQWHASNRNGWPTSVEIRSSRKARCCPWLSASVTPFSPALIRSGARRC